jgi:hypothetical protein
MKKKFIIKEGELDNIVKGILKEFDGDQFELDFDGTQEEHDSVLQLVESQYSEIANEVKEIMGRCYQDNDCYDKLDEVHQRIFSIWQHLDKIHSDSPLVDKFNDLEDAMTDYMETWLNYVNIKEDLEESAEQLLNFLNE